MTSCMAVPHYGVPILTRRVLGSYIGTYMSTYVPKFIRAVGTYV